MLRAAQPSLAVIKWLTFLMFMMFAMTTDSVGVIIPEVIKEFHLSMTVAGAFHYATMAGIAFAGIFLGYLADKLGRRKRSFWGWSCSPSILTCSLSASPSSSFWFSL